MKKVKERFLYMKFQEFNKTVHNGSSIAAVLIAFIVICIAGFEPLYRGVLYWDASQQSFSAYSFFEETVQTGLISYRPILYLLALYPTVRIFCREWQNGYWKSIELRSRKSVYIYGKISAAFWNSFMIMFLSLLFWIVLLLIYCSVFHYPMSFTEEDWVGYSLYPFRDMLFKMIIFSASAGLWGIVSLLFAVLKPDFFLAAGLQMAVYMIIIGIAGKWGGIFRTIGSIETMNAIPERGIITNFVFSLLVTSCLCGLTGMLTAGQLRKRVEYERI